MQSGGHRDGGDPGDFDDGVIEPGELAFAHEDERLPWLEADDDAEEPGVDTGRVVAFVIGALVLLGLVIGALWWFVHDRSETTIVADGSTIRAPAGPYKTKPAKPGGTEAVGTGDTSFAVAEGRDLQGRVAEATEAPRPSIDRNETPTGTATAAPASGGVGVQVGAYSSRDRAEAGWSTLNARFPALDGVSHRIVEGVVDGSPIYRLQAVSGNLAAAQSLCATLQGQGGDCQVKH